MHRLHKNTHKSTEIYHIFSDSSRIFIITSHPSPFTPYGMIRIRISDPRSPGPWYIKWGLSQGGFVGSFEPLWSESSRTTDPDLDHPKGMYPRLTIEGYLYTSAIWMDVSLTSLQLKKVSPHKLFFTPLCYLQGCFVILHRNENKLTILAVRYSIMNSKSHELEQGVHRARAVDREGSVLQLNEWMNEWMNEEQERIKGT